MAVKVTGTIVVNDSRNLENISRINVSSLSTFSSNVLINRTADSTAGQDVKLDIAGSVNAATYFGVSANISNINVASTLALNIGGSERVRVDSTGNLLIGRTTSTVGKNVKLDVAGGVNASSLLINGSPVTGGATGGGSDDIFYENSKNVTTNYTITTNKNAMTTGPVTINSGVTVTVPSGSRWVVL